MPPMRKHSNANGETTMPYRLLATLFAACLLSGCATEPNLYHEARLYQKIDSKVNETRESAYEFCRSTTLRLANTDSISGRVEYHETLSECMRARGYEKP
jgi:hypothetical protein